MATSRAPLAPLVLACLVATHATAARAEAPPSAAVDLTGPIVLQERSPIAFLLSTPTGEAAKTSSSDLIRIVSRRIEAHTSFFLQVVDPQVATDCRGRLGCVVQQLRAPLPRYLLVLSNVTLEGQADRMTILLLDVEVARELANEGRTSGDDADEIRRTEARINQEARLLGPERGQVANADETEAFIEKILVEQLARVFKSTDHWEPYGTIELRGAPEGVAINLDGVPVGATRAGTTRLENVTAGERKVSLERPGYEPWSTSLVVAKQETVTVDADLRKAGSGLAHGARTALLWTGTAAALAGATLGVVAIAAHDGDLAPVCIATPGTTCRSGASFQTLGYRPDATFGDTINPSGIPVAPLGYSLLGAGATWALGTLLYGTDEDFPWIQLAAGLAVGAVAFGVSSALDAGGAQSR